MRARQFRPVFDSLDSRLVLDAGVSAVGVISGVSVGGCLNPPPDDPSFVPTYEDLGNPLNWYLEGSPPPAVYNTDAPQINMN